MIFQLRAGSRIVVLALGLGMLVMLGASLYKRFTEPALTVSRLNAETTPAAETNSGREGMGAIGALMRDAAQNPNDKKTLLKLVEGLMALGEWQSAENFAQKSINLEKPDSPDIRPFYLMAIIQHNQGRHPQAAELLEKVLQKAETPQARYNLGILYLHYLNNPRAGIENLRRGIEDPRVSPALKAAMREELEKAAGFIEPSAGNSGASEIEELEKGAGETLEKNARDVEGAQNLPLP